MDRQQHSSSVIRGRPVSTSPGSPAGADDSGADSRTKKRAKYTSRACTECRRRKIKCLPAVNGAERAVASSCRRCMSRGVNCSNGWLKTTPGRLRTSAVSDRGDANSNSSGPELQALVTQVAKLQEEIAVVVRSVGALSQRSIDGTHDSHETRTGGQTQLSLATNGDSPMSTSEGLEPTGSPDVGQQSFARAGIEIPQRPAPGRDSSSKIFNSPGLPSQVDPLAHCTVEEIVRLLDVFQEEAETIYPVVDSQRLASHAGHILEYSKQGGEPDGICRQTRDLSFTGKDFEIAKIILATAMVIESPEATVRTTSMVESVELEALKIRRPAGDLKHLQLLALLSLYYFHCNEDLLAWRAIGFAARAALELGLHRKTSVMKMFGKSEQREEASRVFWCIYVLDKRWSFGTGLPFNIADRDIDPDLLEPDSPHDYLGCLIRYGRLCSNLWEALFSHGQTHGSISDETAESLNMQTQAWLSSVPPQLRLHSSLSSPPGEPESPPRALQRLRAILHLRANHTRLLIYRHHLSSPARMRSSGNKAAVSVAVARDTVAVLADLHATSDIYARQQNGFNYFLVAAVAAIFLAVCHEPEVFAAECKGSFASAVELVRDLSRFSRASRRLWRSVRGLLPRLKRSGIGAVEVPDGEEIRDEDQQGDPRLEQLVGVPPGVEDWDQTWEEHVQHHRRGDPGPSLADFQLPQGPRGQGELFHYDAAVAQHPAPLDFSLYAYADDSGNELVPEMVDMSNELMELFKTFEEGQQVFPDLTGDAANMARAMAYDPMLLTSEEISRRFQDLI